MLLRNTRAPYDIVEHDNEDRIAFMLERGYVEVSPVPTTKRGKKDFADTMRALAHESPSADTGIPPANLSDSALADALSEDAKE